MAPFRLLTRKLRARRRALQRDALARAPASASPLAPLRGVGVGTGTGVGVSAAAQPVPVPWRVVRRSCGAIDLEWLGCETARQVRFALAGAGLLGLSLPRMVQPGERIRVAVRGLYAEDAAGARDAMLVLRWFQPDGTELLWPIPVE